MLWFFRVWFTLGGEKGAEVRKGVHLQGKRVFQGRQRGLWGFLVIGSVQYSTTGHRVCLFLAWRCEMGVLVAVVFGGKGRGWEGMAVEGRGRVGQPKVWGVKQTFGPEFGSRGKG